MLNQSVYYAYDPFRTKSTCTGQAERTEQTLALSSGPYTKTAQETEAPHHTRPPTPAQTPEPKAHPQQPRPAEQPVAADNVNSSLERLKV